MIYKGTRRHLIFFLYIKEFLFVNVKDFIFYNYICEMYILADKNEIVENKDLYRNKDDF